MGKSAILYDASLCTACRGCQVACKQWNDRKGLQGPAVNRGSYENPGDLSPDTWLRIRFFELERGDGSVNFTFAAQACMHCHDAACVEVCPTKALTHHPEHDYVMLDSSKCNGCGYCSQFCPFRIPRLEGSVASGAAKSFKCVFCQDRMANGQIPACVKTCPSGAMHVGEYDEMVAYAEQRVADLKAKGTTEANIYGPGVLGGLGRIYVLTAPPEALGMLPNPSSLLLARTWQKLVQPVAMASFGLSVITAAAAWIIARRHIRMEEVE